MQRYEVWKWSLGQLEKYGIQKVETQITSCHNEANATAMCKNKQTQTKRNGYHN